MNRRRRPCQPVIVALLLLAGAGGAVGSQAEAPATLTLANAPVLLEYPEPWKDWAISLASYADAAAVDIGKIIGTSLPAGVIRWEPAASGPGSGVDGVVEVGTARSGGARILIRTNVPSLLQDFGASYALGYGRWLGAYAVARIALGAPGGMAPWWTEGAALYLTDRIFRNQRTTTPVLYGIDANFVRAAQSRRPIDLAADTLDAPARGKALATFRLLESLFGAEVVGEAIGKMVRSPSTDLASIVDAIGRDREPDPDALLRDWLQPIIGLDVGIDGVEVRDEGKRLQIRVSRNTPIPVPIELTVRCRDGQTVSASAPIGTDDVRLDVDLPSPAVSVQLDPGGLLPDTNAANNRHGFGSAANVRQFFAFDQRFEVGELRFSGNVEVDATGQRAEQFTVRVENLTEQQTGIGVLVSAEWFDRPERVQRAYFVPLGAGESKVVQESLGYPGRGAGHARIHAKYWEADSIETLTEMLTAKEPGVTNNYIIVRDSPPEAPRRARRDLYRLPPALADTVAAGVDSPPAATAPASVSGPDAAPEAAPADEFTVRLTSPRSGDFPIGDVSLAADVLGRLPVERVDFFVNDRRVGSVTQEPWVLQWTYPDEEQVFVVRAVAVGEDRIASADVVVDRGAASFAATVNLVTLHVTVKDGQGRLIRDLTTADFEVIEDGRAQEIVQVDFGEVPVAAALLLAQSSSMIGGGIIAERAGARRLIETLVHGANRAMIMGFTDQVSVYAPFTSDRAALDAALEAIDPDGSTALFDTLAEAVRKVNRDRGKRALVLLSDGLDTQSRMSFEDVVEYLRQSEVLVYTIGVQLMQDGTEYGDASAAVKRGVESLRTLAESTGGAAYFPLNAEELEEIYALIADELNSQYAISYYPANASYDGRWRELRLRVPSRPDAVVQVRPGYYGVARRPGS